ncbi:CoA transferase [Amycolatopsis bartoniae]|uniref:CoA transferase n=1 Tax=Amycolatopsis bartoniae TaxID=941986 RepID=UPI001E5AD55A|nr:CoA transferase [Amycolatopsis bartoniae]
MENPKDPGYARDFPPALESASGEKFSAFFAQFNRGKFGLTLDLSTPEGKTALRKLARSADVLVENFRPGTMGKLGVGYEVLRQENPRLVYTAISGYGQTSGPVIGAVKPRG